MENYDLDPDKIISWATSYADYEDLEVTAKALYGIYSLRRKRERPDEHKTAKQYGKLYRKNKKAKT